MMRDKEKLCAAVDAFAAAMKAKLLLKADMGWDGWDDDSYLKPGGRNERQICDHFRQVVSGDPEEIDLANLLMFRWHGRIERAARDASCPSESSAGE